MGWETFTYFAAVSMLLSLAGGVTAMAAPRRAAVSLSLSWAGVAVLGAFVAGMWVSLGRPPMRTMGETRLWYSLFVMAAGAMVYGRWRYRWLLLFTTVLSSVFCFINIFRPEIHDRTLVPALQSPFFIPHVTVYMFAYGILACAFLLAVAALVRRGHDYLESVDNLVYIGTGLLFTGERRKARTTASESPGKRHYRPKSATRPRLCADDVMSRVRLKQYQDSYAAAMSKYGLERGIDGSEARHITTQEFYRQAIAQQQDLQENIDALLRLEEQKRKAVEQLKQQERQVRTEYEQTATLQAQKSAELNRTEAELKSVKGELKGARLKNAAAEVGSNIVEGIGAMIGTSRVKRQQQEIDRLNAENAALHEQIGSLNRANREEKARHEQTEQQLQAKLDLIEHWLPDTQTLISWGEYCRDMGIPESGAREIIAMKPLYVSGELHAREYSRRFDVANTEIRLQRDPNGPGGFQLLIDRQPAHAWFRQRYVELMTRLGYPVRPEPSETSRKANRSIKF